MSAHETRAPRLRDEFPTSFQMSEYRQIQWLMAASQSEPVYNTINTNDVQLKSSAPKPHLNILTEVHSQPCERLHSELLSTRDYNYIWNELVYSARWMN